ncbi:MAG: sugar transferase [Flavobacteriales bacterium]
MNLFGCFLIFNAVYSYFQSQDLNVFFYHQFVSVFDGSAIYYSLLFMITLLILFERLVEKISILDLILLVISTSIIILLSSKTFVFILIILFTYYFFKIKKIRLGLITIGLILIGSQFFFNSQNITKRYAQIELNSFFSLKENISESTEFDGYSLRKEFWHMGLEITQESYKTFLFGVGPGDAQIKLNQKIVDRGMYIGEEGTEQTGFLNYNFHNQYIQTFVETGLFGLFVLLLIFYYLFRLGFSTKNRILIAINLVFLLGFATESFLSRQIGIVSFIGLNSLMVFSKNKNTHKQHIKRIFDIVFSGLIILLLLSWLIPILSVIIYLDTKSFPIFVQNRAGQFNSSFRCFKLRTMIKNNEAHDLPAQEDDTRITKLGGFLRKYAIDELPQFFNVLLGDMSVVGPRPLMIKEEEKFNKIVSGFSSRLISKPGVTGLAQANGYKGIVNDNADMRIRYRLDKLYSEKQSLALDVKIIFKTITYLLKKED